MARIIIADRSGQTKEVEQSAYDNGFFPGWTYVGPAGGGTPLQYDPYVDAAAAAAAQFGPSTSAALRAAYGLSVAATASADATLAANKHTPVDATSAARTMTLPTGQAEGTRVIVEKLDSSANTVTVTGSIRGSAATETLIGQYETLNLVADSAGSWHPFSGHKTKTWLNSAYVGQTAQGASDLPQLRAAALRPFWAALADCDNNPCDIVVVDDSTGEGTNSTSNTFYPKNRWANRLVTKLRSQFMTTPGGGPGYIPAYYGITPAITGVGFTWTGSPVQRSDVYGLGIRCVQLNATGQFGTITVSGLTSVDLMYVKTSGGGTFSYQIDGGAATNVSVNAGPPTTYGNKTRVAIPDTGSHTIQINWVSGSVFFEGFMAYNGDETKGIRLWDSSHHGYKLNNFSGDLQSVEWQFSMPATTSLVTVGLFLNDWNAGITSAQATTWLNNLIGVIRTQVPNVPIMLIGKWQRNVTSPVEPWANYINAIRTKAASDPTIYAVDLTKSLLPVTADTLGLFNQSDKVHPTDKGYGFIAQEFFAALRP